MTSHSTIQITLHTDSTFGDDGHGVIHKVYKYWTGYTLKFSNTYTHWRLGYIHNNKCRWRGMDGVYCALPFFIRNLCPSKSQSLFARFFLITFDIMACRISKLSVFAFQGAVLKRSLMFWSNIYITICLNNTTWKVFNIDKNYIDTMFVVTMYSVISFIFSSYFLLRQKIELFQICGSMS